MSSKKVKKSTKKEVIEVEYIIDDTQIKVVTLEESSENVYSRRLRNLQFISLTMVLIITLISPFRLLNSQEIIDITAIGFISASFIPSLIAIFGFIRGRTFSLYISSFIYFIWIIVLSTFEFEIVLMICVLIIYFEVTRIIQVLEPIVENIKSLPLGGAYYHSTVVINRYFKFLLKFGTYLFGISTIFVLLGKYVFNLIQGNILFSIFMIVFLIFIIIFSRMTLTPDLEKVLLEERKERLEKELAESHSKYS